MARNKNMMKLKSLDDIPGEKVQCLVCLSDVGPNTSCVPITTDNFMRDVIQIFGISNSWTSLNLSPENTTCCSSCYQIIDEAKGVSEEVSNLQLTLSSLLDSLKHLFKRSYRTFNQQQEPEDMGQTIRHALVQCWTPCEVRIKKLSIKTFNKNCQIQESQNKVKSGNVDSHYMGHMNTKDHSIVKLTSINRVVSGDTEIVGGKISAGKKSEYVKNIKKVHVEEKAKDTFQCQYCEKLYKKGSFYRKQYNRYIFKCELPNCKQVAQNFRVFCKHHEAQCPQNPDCEKWKPRQKSIIDKFPEANWPMEDNETKNVDPLVLLLKTEGIEDTNAGEKEQSEFMDEWLDDSFVTRSEEFLQENASPENMFSNETEEIQTFHVEVKKGVTFQCKYCKRIFEKGAFYQKQLNRYIFKCDLPNCTQVAQNFMVLRKHHEASCPKNPNYVNWRPRQKVRKEKVNKSISEDSVVSIESNLLLEHGSEADQNARKFNATNFSKKMPDLFRCQYCHQEYTKQRFFQQKHNRYFFKCDLPNCFQVAQNFRVFSMHHEASCPKNPSCSKWKRRQKSVNDLNEQIGNGNAKGDLMQDEAQSQPKYDPWFAENVFSDARSTTKIVRTLIGPGKAKNIFLNSFQCKYCLKEYKKANYFQRQSGKFVFKCELPGCTKVTKNFVVFRQHHQASCPSKPFEDGSFFECKYCKGKYQKSNYYNPETKRFIFKCDQPGCSVIAQNFPVFRKHHEATCPEKPTPTAETFCCGICDKQFASMKTLQNHQIVFHTRNYSYFCDKCGTGAVSLTALNVHMLMHSERKYTCAACPASFRRKQHLRNHELRLHSQNLPHMCDTCGKRFSVRQGLRMHLQNMHGISGTGVCPICKKTFKSPHYVRNHIWSTHRKLRKPKSQSLKSRVDLAGTEANKLLDRLEIELGDENSVSAVSAFSTSSPDNVVTVGF